jgi:hypothetical protein
VFGVSFASQEREGDVFEFDHFPHEGVFVLGVFISCLAHFVKCFGLDVHAIEDHLKHFLEFSYLPFEAVKVI